MKVRTNIGMDWTNRHTKSKRSSAIGASPSSRKMACWLAVAAVPAVVILPAQLRAATTLYWDPSATPANWDVGTTTDWNTSSNGSPANSVWINGDVAQFSDTTFAITPYTANVAAAVSAAGINFTLGNATIDATSANTLTLTGNVSVSSGVTATFGASTSSLLSLVVGANQTWSNSSANALTVNTGVTANGNYTLTDSSGVINLNGVLANGSGALALTVSGGTTNANAANTFTGATNVTGGTLDLGLTNGAIISSSAITVSTGGTLKYDNTTAVNTNRLGSLGLTLNGGTLAYSAYVTNTGASTTANIGPISLGASQSSAFNFGSANTGGTSLVTIASITPSDSHSTLVTFLGNANSSLGAVQVTSASNLTLINGILPWAVETSNGNFLTVSGTNNIGAYGNIFGSDQTTFTNVATDNVKISSAQAALSAPTSENSLVYAYAGTQAFGNKTLTLTSGGLLLNNSSAVLGSAPNDGAITTAAANPQLFIDTNASATINAAIVDASGPTSVALTKYGSNTLTLAGQNTYSGPTTVEQGTLTISSTGLLNTASAVTVVKGSTLNNNGTIGAVTANGTLTIAGSTAVATGNIGGSGSTGVINYTNTLTSGNTLSFAGTNSFSELNNTAAGGQLTLTGPGSVNTFALFPEANAGLSSITTTFQSGTYNFTAGGSNVYANNLGTVNVSGANVTFLSGLRFAEGGGGNITVNSGLLQTFTNFDTNQQTSGTTINYNVKGGVFDVATSDANFGNEGAEAAATNDNLNVSGGLFQVGLTSSASTHNLNIGGSNANVLAAVALSSAGTIRVDGTIQGGNAPAATGVNQLNLTGGTLTATAINLTNLGSNDGTNTSTKGTLYNGGATIAPGYFGQAVNTAVGSANAQFTGKTTITGNYQVDSSNSALAINIGGTTLAPGFGSPSTDYDNVTVTGTIALGGKLTLSLLGSYIPAFAQPFTILTDSTTNGITGSFANVTSTGAQTGTLSLANGATFQLTDNGTTLILNDYTAPSVTWAGTNNVFDTSTQDFYITGGTTLTNFANGDSVIFDNTGIAQPTVNLNVGVTTAALNFANTSGTYLITGTGSITGASLSATGSGGTDIIGVSSSFSGATTIASGATLQLGNGSTVGGVGSLSAITDNGTLAFNRTNTVTQGTDFSSTAITGGANLVQAGSGTLVLTSANTFNGTTTISAGTLQLGAAGATGGIGAAGTLVDNGNLFIDRTGTITQGTDFPAISGTGGLTLGSTGTTVLTLANSYQGVTTIGAGTTLKVGNATATGDLGSSSGVTMNGGSLTFNLTSPYSYAGNITGTGANPLTQAGSGSISVGNVTGISNLTNNNTTGGLTVNQTGAGNSIGTISGASGSVVTINGTPTSSTTIANQLQTPGQTVNLSGGNILLNGPNTYSSTIVVNGATVTTPVNTGQNFFNVVNFTVSSGSFSDTNTYGFRLGSSGGAANDNGVFNASLNVSGGTFFVANNGLNIGDNTPNTNSTLNFSNGTLSTTAAITLGNATTGTGATNFYMSGGLLLTSNTLSGSQGAGAKQDFVWTGGTITASTINVTNLAPTANTAVVSGTTNVLTNGGGTLYPGGTNAGTPVSGMTTVTGSYQGNNNTSDALAFNIGGTTASSAFQDAGLGKFSLLAVSGGVAVDGVLDVTVLTGYTPSSPSQLYKVVTAGTAVTGTFTNLTLVSGNTYSGTTQDGGYTYEAIFNNAGNNITLTDFAAVPEPSSLSLLGIAGLALMRRRRKMVEAN